MLGSKKGQLVFEFVIAALVLFSMVLYSINYAGSAMGKYRDAFMDGMRESKAIYISLIVAREVSSEWPKIDNAKITSYAASCSGAYENYQKKYGLVKRIPGHELFMHFHVDATDEDGSSLINCGPVFSGKTASGTASRIGMLNGQPVMINVTVW